jgi:hypothetical protein
LDLSNLFLACAICFYFDLQLPVLFTVFPPHLFSRPGLCSVPHLYAGAQIAPPRFQLLCRRPYVLAL